MVGPARNLLAAGVGLNGRGGFQQTLQLHQSIFTVVDRQ
jgi:hypothetical protein